MSKSENSSRKATNDSSRSGRRDWNWQPELPIKNSPLFSWPIQPLALLHWLNDSWKLISQKTFMVLIAIIIWVFFQPSLVLCKEFSFDWIVIVYLRNLALILLVAGGLHIYFYSWKKQGLEGKLNAQDLNYNSGIYTFNNQVLDNMFWSIVSGVTFWTMYEVGMFWAYANNYIPMLNWNDNPVWFLLLFFLIPIWNAFHFYCIHRLLHWRPLYKAAHALHHRNVNPGPWSGISMHPLEHILYFSSVLIHVAIASHPIHLLFHTQYLITGAITSHCGYAGFYVSHKNRFSLAFYFHQLHHKYFECNYGNADFPMDKWVGSFHDGTAEATLEVKNRLSQYKKS